MIGQAELKMPIMTARFGEMIGHELLQSDFAGESLVQVVYPLHFDKHAMVWRSILYHGSEGWVINPFTFADDITTVF